MPDTSDGGDGEGATMMEIGNKTGQLDLDSDTGNWA